MKRVLAGVEMGPHLVALARAGVGTQAEVEVEAGARTKVTARGGVIVAVDAGVNAIVALSIKPIVMISYLMNQTVLRRGYVEVVG